jgi:hypothetical protein
MMEEPEPVAFLNLVQPDPMVRAAWRVARCVARASEAAARKALSGLGMCDASACPRWR